MAARLALYQSLFCLGLSAVCVLVQAEESAQTEKQESPQQTDVLEEIVLEPRIDRSKDWLVDRIDDFSEDLDVFFVQTFFNSEVFEDDIGGSRAVIAFDTRREFGGDVDYKLSGRLKLELPNTNKRMKLLVASEDDSEYDINKKPIQNIQNATYSTAVRYLIKERSAWKTDLDIGLRGGLPFNPYTRVRARRYGDSFGWQHRFTQNLYYLHIEGWGEATQLRLDKNILKDHLLIFNIEADYLLKNNYFDLETDVTVYRKFNEHSVLAYQVGAQGNTDRGSVVNSYFTGVKFRNRIYKDWIYASINPQIEWNKNREYRRMWVLMFNFEAILSSK